MSHGPKEAWEVEAGRKLKGVEVDHVFQDVVDVLERLCSAGVLEVKKKGKRACSYRCQPFYLLLQTFPSRVIEEQRTGDKQFEEVSVPTYMPALGEPEDVPQLKHQPMAGLDGPAEGVREGGDSTEVVVAIVVDILNFLRIQ